MTKPKQKEPTVLNISDTVFAGAYFDPTAAAAIQTVANALLENAKSLGKLAEVFKASNIQIESMIRVTGTDTSINGDNVSLHGK